MFLKHHKNAFTLFFLSRILYTLSRKKKKLTAFFFYFFFGAPIILKFGVQERRTFLKENPEEDCDSWNHMASSEKIGATDEEKIVDAYTQAEVFLHEGDYVKVLEIYNRGNHLRSRRESIMLSPPSSPRRRVL